MRRDSETNWVEISEEMPPQGKKVWLFQYVDGFRTEPKIGWLSDWFFRDESQPIPQVTHWANITTPPPPRIDGNAE